MYPSVLSRYLVKVYLEKLFIVFVVISGALILSNIFDLLNKVRGITIGSGIFLKLIFLKLPYLVLELIPLNAMLAAFLMNYSLAKRNEIFIIWGSGISIFRLLLPVLSISFLIGIFSVAILNPLSTYMLVRYETLEAKFTERKMPNLALSSLGIIISEPYEGERRIYIAKSVAVSDQKMKQVTALFANEANSFIERIEAEEAILEDSNFVLNKVSIFGKDGNRFDKEQHIIPTNLEINNLVEGVTAPDHLNFWKLPEAIHNLTKAGLPSSKHQLYYYKLLLRPLVMVAYIMLASCFMFGEMRSKNRISSLSLGVFIGFSTYLISQVVTNILAYNGISPLWSIVSPTLIVILVSNLAILHLRRD